MQSYFRFSYSLLIFFFAVHSAPASDTALEIGRYYKGDGLGTNISIVLAADGSYEATWTGCLGNYGNSKGRWEIEGTMLTFLPSAEDGMLEDFLGEMKIVEYKGQAAFVAAHSQTQHEELIAEFGRSFHVYTLRTP